MKKTVRILALALCVCLLLTFLTACGKKLSGEYSAELMESGVTYSFKGSNVTITLNALGKIIHVVEGKYEIEDDTITFTFPGDEENTEDYVGTKSFEEGEEYIKIGKITYTKK